MKSGCILLALTVCLLASPARAERALRLDLGAGASSRNGPTEGLSTPRRLSGLAAVSAPAGHGFRAVAEAQYMRYENTRSHWTLTGAEAFRLPDTSFLGAMVGLEWQPPLQSSWTPFVHATIGAARLTTKEPRDPSDGASTALVSRPRGSPAWSAGIGVRGRLAGGGPGLFADARYTHVEHGADALLRSNQLALTQMLAGVSF